LWTGLDFWEDQFDASVEDHSHSVPRIGRDESIDEVFRPELLKGDLVPFVSLSGYVHSHAVAAAMDADSSFSIALLTTEMISSATC
jgi:hypothetical protein